MILARNRPQREVTSYWSTKGLILALMVLLWIFLWFSSSRPVTPTLRPIFVKSPTNGSKVMVKDAKWIGVAEPYAEVKLLAGDRVLGAAISDPSGNFEIVPSLSPPYPDKLRVSQQLANGKMGTSDTFSYRWQESADVMFSLTSGMPPTHPAGEELVLSGTADGPGVVYLMADGAALSSSEVPQAGPWRLATKFLAPYPKTVSLLFKANSSDSRVTAGPFPLILEGAEPSDGVFRITRPVTDGVVTTGDWVIAGTGKAGESVAVRMDKYSLGATKVAADGTWQVPRTIFVASKGRLMVATQTDGAKQSVTVDVLPR